MKFDVPNWSARIKGTCEWDSKKEQFEKKKLNKEKKKILNENPIN